MQGIVQHFDLLKGFGFIREGFRDQRFFHISNWNSDTAPRRGMPVWYDVAPPRKAGQSDQAINVVPLAEFLARSEAATALADSTTSTNPSTEVSK